MKYSDLPIWCCEVFCLYESYTFSSWTCAEWRNLNIVAQICRGKKNNSDFSDLDQINLHWKLKITQWKKALNIKINQIWSIEVCILSQSHTHSEEEVSSRKVQNHTHLQKLITPWNFLKYSFSPNKWSGEKTCTQPRHIASKLTKNASTLFQNNVFQSEKIGRIHVLTKLIISKLATHQIQLIHKNIHQNYRIQIEILTRLLIIKCQRNNKKL